MAVIVQRGDLPIMHEGAGNGILHTDSSPAIDLDTTVLPCIPKAPSALGPAFPRIRSSVLRLIESFWQISSIPSSVSFEISIILYLSVWVLVLTDLS
jgi:hypothetical protein